MIIEFILALMITRRRFSIHSREDFHENFHDHIFTIARDI